MQIWFYKHIGEGRYAAAQGYRKTLRVKVSPTINTKLELVAHRESDGLWSVFEIPTGYCLTFGSRTRRAAWESITPRLLVITAQLQQREEYRQRCAELAAYKAARTAENMEV